MTRDTHLTVRPCPYTTALRTPPSVNLRRVANPERSAQLTFQHFARTRFRQGVVAQVNLFGHFIARYILMTEGNEGGRIDRLSGTGHHDPVHRLTPLRIRHPEHGRLEHRRVLVEHFFHFGAVDVLASRDDHVADTVHQEKVALGVHVTEITTVIPAVAQRLGGLGGFVPIPLHNIRAAYHDLANLSRRPLVAIGAEDPHIDPGDRLPARARYVAVHERFFMA